MKSIKKALARFRSLGKEEDGVTMMEYVLIGALISIAAIAVLPGVGTAVLNMFTAIRDALAGGGGG